MTEQLTAEQKLQQLIALKEAAALGGGPKRIEAQHARGKLTARERIDLLLDPGTFEELDMLMRPRGSLAGGNVEAVVTGWGKVDGRPVYVFSYDFTVAGGSLSEAVAEKILKVMDLAMMTGAPIVGVQDSGGARIQDGPDSLRGFGEIFAMNTLASGVVPQISVIMGPCAGGAVYSPAITDFVFMAEGSSYMFITGPDVVKSVTGEEVTQETLGGADVHASRSGVAHFAIAGEEATLAEVRRLLSFLPSNNAEDPPFVPTNDDVNRTEEDLLTIVPAEPNRPYDVRDVIERIVDDGDFMEVQQAFAPNIVIGFARMGGRSVGFVANQPMHLAGSLDINASRKAARFVRFCDCFNIPLVTLVDVPGYLPGTSQEYNGIITHGAKLLYAYSEATVPKVAVVLRKAYGGAYVVMSSKHLRGDMNFAWPTGEIAVMGPDGAANVVYRDEIANAPDPEAKRKELIEEYRQKFANPYIPAGRGFIDDVIDPRQTRPKIIRALEMLQNKADRNPPKKHGNIPL
ncbi:acyl-CoA carboxylase subunit beta [Tepidiforma thermophila]|uniref:Propionyl-CoA carboxylase carboxyltransferase subunit n=1 Tax=Tepidiforma thermophila (strain KCTC 52669 / CGMCC 1.13589 / G233) TaxID=2761530 RepID=A0A2A9HDM9_TEPT2|nr:acyl-CoA carboxylase subunit beta [Tepidiforma thermophila]PFG74104.1 propionyl-CoA carboxylase carboxyltransferase subunit [Tepidiforma thermophila]